MDFESVVKRRRMCREYLDKDVPEEKVDRILDVASRYPSAGHTEPQEFIVVRDQRVKEDLARAALGQRFVVQAPLVIVVISDTRRYRWSLRRDAYAACGGERGFGHLFRRSVLQSGVQEVLGLPLHIRPIGVIPIGYCAEGPRKLRRRSRAQIVHRDRYGSR
jgi:nitroreductase